MLKENEAFSLGRLLSLLTRFPAFSSSASYSLICFQDKFTSCLGNNNSEFQVKCEKKELKPKKAVGNTTYLFRFFPNIETTFSILSSSSQHSHSIPSQSGTERIQHCHSLMETISYMQQIIPVPQPLSTTKKCPHRGGELSILG